MSTRRREIDTQLGRMYDVYDIVYKGESIVIVSY